MQTLDKIREAMGFPPFVKIDPNTQDIPVNEPDARHQRLGQAAICAVLEGIYKYSRTEEGFFYLVNKDRNMPWGQMLFGDEENKLVHNVANYSASDEADVRNVMQEAGNVAWETAGHELEGHFTLDSVGKLFGSMRTDILQYLPAALQLGKILNDTSIDDRTNKMEGPASGFLHRVEKLFSQPQKLTAMK
jgi:hypothetical protein